MKEVLCMEVLLLIWSAVQIPMHIFKINIVGLSINKWFYMYKADDDDALNEYHMDMLVRYITILVIDGIGLVLLLMGHLRISLGVMLVGIFAASIISSIKDKNRF
ncbi:MAG: hypothetical protein ACI4D1_00395 [Lachnospira sp.]